VKSRYDQGLSALQQQTQNLILEFYTGTYSGCTLQVQYEVKRLQSDADNLMLPR